MGKRIQNIQKDPAQFKDLSKFLAKVLRHRPEMIELELDSAGWAAVNDLLVALNSRGHSVSREDLDFVVAHNDKNRYAYNECGTRIRASQGHSIDVELKLQPVIPPDVLFHGTNEEAKSAILVEGIKKMWRHHVHLSTSPEAAKSIGARRGSPVVFRVNARAMVEENYAFFVSTNGVWLTDDVPPRFIGLQI